MRPYPRPGILAALALSLGLTSCSVVREISRTVTNLSRCTFRLHGVSDFRLAGISLSGKTRFGITDAAQAVASFSRGELPAAFTLNVAAQNPNDGTGGTPRSTATLTSFAWNLRIDDIPTIAGDIASPVEIPGTGQQSVIPLRMELDLKKFFGDRGYEKIVNLAFALGGSEGSASRITLRAKPTIRTDLGPITYPGEIDIIDREFRGQ